MAHADQKPRNGRLGNVAALSRVTRQVAPHNGSATPGDAAAAALNQRKLVADFCKLLAPRNGKPMVASAVPSALIHADLSPRLRQTLERLLCGDGEKQIAARLKLSTHTVHVYVKALHKRYNVSSRSELLAHFIPHANAS